MMISEATLMLEKAAFTKGQNEWTAEVILRDYLGLIDFKTNSIRLYIKRRYWLTSLSNASFLFWTSFQFVKSEHIFSLLSFGHFYSLFLNIAFSCSCKMLKMQSSLAWQVITLYYEEGEHNYSLLQGALINPTVEIEAPNRIHINIIFLQRNKKKHIVLF